MTVSFVRIDDRMIHGQTVTRWAKEYPCDGLIAVNNAAAGNKVLIQAILSEATAALQEFEVVSDAADEDEDDI